MSLLAEAVRSSFQPCSFAILLPALVLVVLRKNQRLTALAVFVSMAVLAAWLPMTSAPDLLLDRAVVGAVILIAGLSLIGWVRHPVAGWGGAGLLGLFAGSTWVPCVGAQLGAVLTLGQSDPLAALPRLALYLFGVAVPVTIVAVLLVFLPFARRLADNQWTRLSAQVAATTLGVIVVTGNYPGLLSELARRSSL